jgi:hypothetical protein
MTVMAKEAFNKKKAIYIIKFGINLGMKLVKCYICGLALYGAETWILRDIGQKNLGSF